MATRLLGINGKNRRFTVCSSEKPAYNARQFARKKHETQPLFCYPQSAAN
ncbi:hypothetical protein SSYIS1_03380 [Serratia symbiotica]|uniref:Uncharacterized protein n=1 Tax=Serratia symbiotica TaxID=138074 RepID=A0A455VDU6_9GAMM|nr:hypothetical protein SSYIS1_03380 [Serratia symbiotica]